MAAEGPNIWGRGLLCVERDVRGQFLGNKMQQLEGMPGILFVNVKLFRVDSNILLLLSSYLFDGSK